MLLAIGAAKEKAGRNSHRLVIIHLPAAGETVSAETLRIELDRDKLKDTRRHEGQYLLRSNLSGENPAELRRNYMNLVRIEESFRTLKGDLGLRPIFHPEIRSCKRGWGAQVLMLATIGDETERIIRSLIG